MAGLIIFYPVFSMPQGAFSSVLDSAMVCLMRIIKQTKYEAISQEHECYAGNMIFKAHQGCIYLMKQSKTIIL